MSGNYESVFDNGNVRVKLADTEDGIALSLDFVEDGESTAGTTLYLGQEQIDGMCAWLEKYRSARPEAPLNDARLSELAKRVIDYDNAIESCGNDPDKMSSLCTAQGDDLDTLYFMMVDAAKAIKRDETIPSPQLRSQEER